MPKRKPTLPQQWPGHCFSRADTEAIIEKLASHQSRTSASFAGERFAIALLEKTPQELKKMLKRLDNEGGNALTDSLLAAEESLRLRLKLVTAAFARVAIASGVAPWVEPDEPDQAEGGAHG
jgi:hypothetical protein